MLTVTLYLLLALSLSSAPELPQTSEYEAPVEIIYEDPAECECYFDEATGRTVCNSACPPGVKRF